METASFNGLLKAILYILAFYYIVKFLAKLFLPVVAKKVVEKATKQFQEQQQQYQQVQWLNVGNSLLLQSMVFLSVL